MGFTDRQVTQAARGLLHRVFTLTLSPCNKAVCFLWHFPWGCPRRALPGTLPCGARTFLPPKRAAVCTATIDTQGYHHTDQQTSPALSDALASEILEQSRNLPLYLGVEPASSAQVEHSGKRRDDGEGGPDHHRAGE